VHALTVRFTLYMYRVPYFTSAGQTATLLPALTPEAAAAFEYERKNGGKYR